MKIYNEVVSKFNEITNKWETISEDSFEYGGPVSLAQGAPPNSKAINASDTISDTIKTTTGYFTDGDGTLSGDSIYTGSINDTNEKSYFDIHHKIPTDSTSEKQFSVTYGHIEGKGSDTYGDSSVTSTTLKGESQAIYKQLSEMLQIDNEQSGGFKIASQGSDLAGGTIPAKGKDEYIYALIGTRDRFKERMNKKVWTLSLSGSNTTGSGVSLQLTDDSKTVAAVATPGGPRHNIVSGALGNVNTAYSTKSYGWFYPEMGIMLFSGAQLSASIPGGPNYGNDLDVVVSASHGRSTFSASAQTALTTLNVGDMFQFVSSSGAIQTFQVSGSTPTAAGFTGSANYVGSADDTHYTGSIRVGRKTSEITASWGTSTGLIGSSSGFSPNLNQKGNSNNALRLANCMRLVGTTSALRLRSEEDLTEENYFCRINADEFNFSSNHTFVSGSKNKLRNKGMFGNPNTFITSVGLFNSSGQLLAIAKLSKPLSKNFASESTIKVKLTY